MVCLLSYLAVHTFGRRMLYPGATALIQALIGKLWCCNYCMLLVFVTHDYACFCSCVTKIDLCGNSHLRDCGKAIWSISLEKVE